MFWNTDKVNIPVCEDRLGSSDIVPEKVIAFRKSEVKPALENSTLVSESYEVLVDADKEYIQVRHFNE